MCIRDRSVNGIGTDPFSSFERFREKIEREESEAEAHEEIAGSSAPSLEESFAKLERRETIEDELQALKKKLGKGSSDPEPEGN